MSSSSYQRQIPRPEYPRPQFQRGRWINLNGEWSVEIDLSRSGVERRLYKQRGFERRILVPFCPESDLSGIGHRDFIEGLWYHRTISIPEDWSGARVLLHFGAVDYEAHIYIDGILINSHYGGSTSFTCDLTKFVRPGGEHNLVVHAKDEIRAGLQPGGKQSLEFESKGCFYSRVTGIWQTVWMEAVSPFGVEGLEILPDIDSSALHLVLKPHALSKEPLSAKVSVIESGSVISMRQTRVVKETRLVMPIEGSLKLWSPEDPFLYDIRVEFINQVGEVVEEASSYTGMRKVHVAGNELFLNNEPYYLRLVLDQGFYPDGIWTAPSDDALRRDIELSKEAGFNGARLHQKIFEERFHYWADKLGYVTWGEFPSWGINIKSDASARNFLSEWREAVIRDRNHPSILAWTPLNETWDISDRARHYRLHVEAYELTKSLDPTRPVNGASGGCQVLTDLYCVHNYEQDPEMLRQSLTPKEDGAVYQTLGDKEAPYSGQPYYVDEFGGAKWIPPSSAEHGAHSWGYGEAPLTEEEWFKRLQSQVQALLSLPHVQGYCYTQLTDVEQEQNGIYSYDRSPKFDIEKIRSVFSKNPTGSE